MAKKKRKKQVPYTLIVICIISGICTLVLRMLNRRMRVPELSEIAAIAGTAFAISLIIILGIWIIRFVSQK